MSRHVVVRVPASTSNLGAGFDCVGVAVDRWLTVSATIEESATAPIAIERGGTLADLTLSPEDDVLTAGFRAACHITGRPVPSGLRVRAHSDIPIARGLGSSGAAVLAGAAAANVLLDLGLADRAILGIATEREGHPDNVAASLCGGAVLVLDARERGPGVVTVHLPVQAGLAFVFAVPDFAVETKHARKILPRRVGHRLATLAVARGAALVHGLATANETLLGQALDDVLHVPFRRMLVPGYDDVVGAARRAGAYGATLSGSGSSIVAIAPRPRADAVGDAMTGAWAARGITATHFVNAPRVPGYSAVADAPLPRTLAGRPSAPLSVSTP